MALVRLDKLTADATGASRRDVSAWIRAGRVSVDGTVVRDGARKVDADCALALDGENIRYAPAHYIMLHKPAGVVSATEDSRERTVLDLLPEAWRRWNLFPVGRLDKDTTGLLLLTDDGTFAHKVLSPKNHIPKRYRAEVDGLLDASDIEALAAGICLRDGTQCLPAELLLPEEPSSVCEIVLYEGNQVKRMLAALGKPVVRLHRLAMGALYLDEGLEAGAYRFLSEQEKNSVLAKV